MTRLFARRRTLALVAMLAIAGGAVTLSACDDDNGPSNNGSIAIAVEPTSLDISPGNTGTSDFTVTRTAPFASAVTLTASGAPASFDITLSPGVLAAGETTGTITVLVGAEAAPGSYPITLTATGTGITAVSATLTVVVTEVPAGVKR